MFVQFKNIRICIGILLSVFIVAIVSCSKSKIDTNIPTPLEDVDGKQYFETTEELLEWAAESPEVVKQRIIGDWKYTLKQLTPDIMALQELRGKPSNPIVFDEAKSHYSDLLYFKLNIQNDKFPNELLKYDVKDNQEYSNRVKYCSFEINRDFFLTNGLDTVPCVLHEFERTFNVPSGLNFMITFPKIATGKGLTAVFHDQLFKQGLIKFHFTKDQKKLPYLKIK